MAHLHCYQCGRKGAAMKCKNCSTVFCSAECLQKSWTHGQGHREFCKEITDTIVAFRQLIENEKNTTVGMPLDDDKDKEALRKRPHEAAALYEPPSKRARTDEEVDKETKLATFLEERTTKMANMLAFIQNMGVNLMSTRELTVMATAVSTHMPELAGEIARVRLVRSLRVFTDIFFRQDDHQEGSQRTRADMPHGLSHVREILGGIWNSNYERLHSKRLDSGMPNWQDFFISAFSGNHLDCAKYMLKEMGSVNVKTLLADRWIDLLKKVCNNDDSVIMEYLIQQKAVMEVDAIVCRDTLYLEVHNNHKVLRILVNAHLLNKGNININTYYTKVAEAIRNNHIELEKILLELWPEHLQAPYNELIKILTVASANGRADAVEMLFKAGLKIDVTRPYDEDAVFQAVIRGHVEIVGLFMKAGLTLDDVRPIYYIALMRAVSTDQSEIVKLILEMGLNVDDVRANDNEALQRAVKYDHANIVKLLLETGLNEDDVRAGNNELLRHAAMFGKTKIVKLLLETGLNANDVRANDNEALRRAGDCTHPYAVGTTEIVLMLLAMGLNANDVRANDNEALRRAVEHGHTEIVRALLAKGLTADDVRANDNEALRSVMDNYATDNASATELVLMLLKTGLEVDDVRANDNEALLSACKRGFTGVVRVLLETGLTVDDVRANDNEALLLACKGGHTEIVHLLVNTGLKIDDIRTRFCLINAIVSRRAEMVRLLLTEWLDNTDITRSNNYALRKAIKTYNNEIVQILLERLTVDEIRVADNIVLAGAVDQEQKTIVQMILDKGLGRADILSNNSYAIRSAVANGNSAILQILLAKGLTGTDLCSINPPILYDAIATGDEEILNMLFTAGLTVARARDNNYQMFSIPYFRNKFSALLRILVQNGLNTAEDIVAMVFDNPELIAELVTLNVAFPIHSLLRRSIVDGNVRMLEWLRTDMGVTMQDVMENLNRDGNKGHVSAKGGSAIDIVFGFKK